MTDKTVPEQKRRRWLYPILFVAFIIVSMLPLYTEKPYDPRETQDVILSVLMVSVGPYEALGPVFHLATIAIVVLIVFLEEKMGRVLAAYMGLNYLLIGFVQTMGTTEKYGFVIHTGALVMCLVLGIAWIVVAVRGGLKPSFRGVQPYKYLFLPLALLVFWSPFVGINEAVRPYFNPLRLLTSPEYGLTYCFTTPVFLFLLILFYPKVNDFAYRITAVNGFIYGLLNMTHFFNPGLTWMGVLHLPLLLISLYALILPAITKRRETIT